MKAQRLKQASDIKVGVVGYGGAFNMGRQHLQLAQQAGLTPVAVAEIDPARLEVATKDFPGIETYRSLPAMLKKSAVSLVVLITPHNLHAPQGVHCLRAGRHVISEKPLAITTGEVDALIATARKNKLMLSTYHNRHWDGCIVEAVRQIKREKVIGDIVRIEAHMGGYGKPADWWRSSRKYSGGILYDWGVHLLEYALQLLDGEITEVTGFAHDGHWAPQLPWKKDSNEDEAFAVVRFSSRQWLTLCLTQIDSKGKDGWLEITGTKGTYVMDGGTWRVYRCGGATELILRGRNPENNHRCYYENVAAHLTQGAPLVITGEWSRRPIHILDLAVESARQGRALRAKYG